MPTPEPVRQIAYVVDDVRKAAERHHALFGSGPFFVLDRLALSVEFRGQPEVPFTSSSAFGQWGEIQVELIQSHDSGPSVLNEMYPPGSGRYGLHHVAIIADDLDATSRRIEREGSPLVLRAHLPQMDMRIVMADATQSLGHYVEMYQSGPAILDFYRSIKAAADGFTGEDLIRELTL